MTGARRGICRSRQPRQRSVTRAGERAVKRFNPGTVKSGQMPVVFDPRVGSSFVGHLLGAISAGRRLRAKQASCWTPMASNCSTAVYRSSTIRIASAGSGPRPLMAKACPPRAVRSSTMASLTGWLMESASARQLGLQPTGHASRGVSGAPGVSPSNLHLEGGSASVAELIADIKHGIYVHELAGRASIRDGRLQPRGRRFPHHRRRNCRTGE